MPADAARTFWAFLGLFGPGNPAVTVTHVELKFQSCIQSNPIRNGFLVQLRGYTGRRFLSKIRGRVEFKAKVRGSCEDSAVRGAGAPGADAARASAASRGLRWRWRVRARLGRFAECPGQYICAHPWPPPNISRVREHDASLRALPAPPGPRCSSDLHPIRARLAHDILLPHPREYGPRCLPARAPRTTVPRREYGDLAPTRARSSYLHPPNAALTEYPRVRGLGAFPRALPAARAALLLVPAPPREGVGRGALASYPTRRPRTRTIRELGRYVPQRANALRRERKAKAGKALTPFGAGAAFGGSIGAGIGCVRRGGEHVLVGGTAAAHGRVQDGRDAPHGAFDDAGSVRERERGGPEERQRGWGVGVGGAGVNVGVGEGVFLLDHLNVLLFEDVLERDVRAAHGRVGGLDVDVRAAPSARLARRGELIRQRLRDLCRERRMDQGLPGMWNALERKLKEKVGGKTRRRESKSSQEVWELEIPRNVLRSILPALPALPSPIEMPETMDFGITHEVPFGVPLWQLMECQVRARKYYLGATIPACEATVSIRGMLMAIWNEHPYHAGCRIKAQPFGSDDKSHRSCDETSHHAVLFPTPKRTQSSPDLIKSRACFFNLNLTLQISGPSPRVRLPSFSVFSRSDWRGRRIDCRGWIPGVAVTREVSSSTTCDVGHFNSGVRSAIGLSTLEKKDGSRPAISRTNST
ncbi:hypothetical protein DFH09DRAFT_1096569 [Mycena vulgaris]|nr:hypothetical protein DFH09DRAFT_1096569 [Mycena vulgaris]